MIVTRTIRLSAKQSCIVSRFYDRETATFYEILPGFTRLYDGTGKRGFLSFVVRSIGTSFFLVVWCPSTSESVVAQEDS